MSSTHMLHLYVGDRPSHESHVLSYSTHMPLLCVGDLLSHDCHVLLYSTNSIPSHLIMQIYFCCVIKFVCCLVFCWLINLQCSCWDIFSEIGLNLILLTVHEGHELEIDENAARPEEDRLTQAEKSERINKQLKVMEFKDYFYSDLVKYA